MSRELVEVHLGVVHVLLGGVVDHLVTVEVGPDQEADQGLEAVHGISPGLQDDFVLDLHDTVVADQDHRSCDPVTVLLVRSLACYVVNVLGYVIILLSIINVLACVIIIPCIISY